MDTDPRRLWWPKLFAGWLTGDRPSGNGYGYGDGYGYSGYGDGYGDGCGCGGGRRTYA